MDESVLAYLATEGIYTYEVKSVSYQEIPPYSPLPYSEGKQQTMSHLADWQNQVLHSLADHSEIFLEKEQVNNYGNKIYEDHLHRAEALGLTEADYTSSTLETQGLSLYTYCQKEAQRKIKSMLCVAYLAKLWGLKGGGKEHDTREQYLSIQERVISCFYHGNL
ncbi:MAG: hypothetical protein K6G62_06105 [Eubacterium sp.]|nr:hypothetical protein [Eubacterium sp.]